MICDPVRAVAANFAIAPRANSPIAAELAELVDLADLTEVLSRRVALDFAEVT
jgi:hypothetical protein